MRLQATDFGNDPYCDKWSAMTQFEKVCWHWVKKDGFIHAAVKDDPRAMTVKFEDIFNKENGYQGLWEMVEFMGIGSDRDAFKKQCVLSMDKKLNVNKKEEFGHWQEWPQEQKKQFQTIAGEYMKTYGYDIGEVV
jgi:hypothetical protein